MFLYRVFLRHEPFANEISPPPKVLLEGDNLGDLGHWFPEHACNAEARAHQCQMWQIETHCQCAPRFIQRKGVTNWRSFSSGKWPHRGPSKISSRRFLAVQSSLASFSSSVCQVSGYFGLVSSSAVRVQFTHSELGEPKRACDWRTTARWNCGWKLNK